MERFKPPFRYNIFNKNGLEMICFEENYQLEQLRVKNYRDLGVFRMCKGIKTPISITNVKDFKGYSTSLGRFPRFSMGNYKESNGEYCLVCPNEPKVGEFLTVVSLIVTPAVYLLLSIERLNNEEKEKLVIILLDKGLDCEDKIQPCDSNESPVKKKKCYGLHIIQHRDSEMNPVNEKLKIKIPELLNKEKLFELIKEYAAEIPLPEGSLSVAELNNIAIQKKIEKNIEDQLCSFGRRYSKKCSSSVVRSLKVNKTAISIQYELNVNDSFEGCVFDELKKEAQSWDTMKIGSECSKVEWDVMYTYVVRIEKKAFVVLLQDLKKLEEWMNGKNIELKKEENDEWCSLQIVCKDIREVKEASERMDRIIEGEKYHYRDPKSKMYQKRHFFTKAGRDFLQKIENKYQGKIFVKFYPYIGVVQVQGENEYLSNVKNQMEKYLENDEKEYLCENNEENRICSICTDTLEVFNHQLKKCGHFACSLCFYEQVIGLKQTRLFPIKCAECNEILAFSDLMTVLRSCFVTGSDLYFKSYEGFIDALFEIVKDTNYFECPNVICSNLVDKSELKGSGKNRNCKTCGQAYCVICKSASHPDTCEENKIKLSKLDESLHNYLKNHAAAFCPGCFCLIEKNEGCLLMQCTNCNIFFCWLCKFMDKSDQFVYHHISNDHSRLLL